MQFSADFCITTKTWPVFLLKKLTTQFNEFLVRDLKRYYNKKNNSFFFFGFQNYVN